MHEYPAAWGTIKELHLAAECDSDDPDAPATVELQSSWHDLIFPDEHGEYHHGTRASIEPDTVVVRFEDRTVALADVFAHTIENQYCYDAEYFLVVRLREILDPAAWARLPWPTFEPGDVFLAWDKFHGHEYSRTPDSDQAMSYGGDWTDLQRYIDDLHPRPEGPRPTAGPASPASLLRAVRSGDLAEVRALLAAGADPNAGEDAPDAALRSVSVDRNTTALWEAISRGDPELVDALLVAGARVNAPGQYSPLHGAFLNRKLAVVPVLLRHGADPDARAFDRTPRDLAAELGPDALALLPAARS